jgi:hypothetical protein
MSAVADSDSALRRHAVDLLCERYASWREECRAVRQTYRSWIEAGHRQRDLAYADYLAALGREEHAANAYAGQVERVGRFYL